MREEGLIHSPEQALPIPCQLNNRKLPNQYLITASASSLLTTKSPSPIITPSSHFTLRRESTWGFPESSHVRVAEVSNSSKLSSPRTEISNRRRSANIQSKRWISPLTTSGTRTRQKPSERVNFRGATKTSSSSLANQTVPLICKNSNSTTHDSQKSSIMSDPRECGPATSVDVLVGDTEGSMEELSAEEIERERNIEKCLNWIANLPAKFSGMHIIQERIPVIVD